MNKIITSFDRWRRLAVARWKSETPPFFARLKRIFGRLAAFFTSLLTAYGAIIAIRPAYADFIPAWVLQVCVPAALVCGAIAGMAKLTTTDPELSKK